MNEIFFLGFILFDLFAALLCLRFFGKSGIVIFYITHVIMSQVTVKMQIDLLGFTTIFGSVLYAVLFLATDVMTEHYGKEEGYKLVNLGVLSLGVFIFIVQAAGIFAPSTTNTAYSSFRNLFDSQWRVVGADVVVSYFIFQRFSVWIFQKLSEWTNGKHLWLRNNLSTWISETLTAIIFFQIAFIGQIPQNILWQIIIVGLGMKLFVALLETPFMYLSYRFLPKEKQAGTLVEQTA